MAARRSRRPRRLYVRVPETPMELALLMLSSLVTDASGIVWRMELMIVKSRDHRLRDDLLHTLYDAMALRDYAESCIERLLAFAELQSGGGR